MKTICRFALSFLFAFAAVCANAAPAMPNRFFAMDTAGGSLDLLKELGYAGQAGTFRGNADDAARQIAELEKRGMTMCAIYAGAKLNKDGFHFGGDFAKLLAALKGHDVLIWIHTSSKDFRPSAEEGDAIAVPALQQLADQAAAAGLRIAIYPHRDMWTERVQDGIRLAEKVNRKNFGVTFNLCHCLSVGDGEKIPQLLEQARPHLFMVTINGADTGGTNWQQLIQPLGSGTYDPGIVLRKLQQLAYTGPVAFQGFGIGGDRREILTKTMQAWQTLSGQTAK